MGSISYYLLLSEALENVIAARGREFYTNLSMLFFLLIVFVFWDAINCVPLVGRIMNRARTPFDAEKKQDRGSWHQRS